MPLCPVLLIFKNKHYLKEARGDSFYFVRHFTVKSEKAPTRRTQCSGALETVEKRLHLGEAVIVPGCPGTPSFHLKRGVPHQRFHSCEVLESLLLPPLTLQHHRQRKRDAGLLPRWTSAADTALTVGHNPAKEVCAVTLVQVRGKDFTQRDVNARKAFLHLSISEHDCNRILDSALKSVREVWEECRQRSLLAPGRESWRQEGHWLLPLLWADSIFVFLQREAELSSMWLAEQGDGLEGDGPGCHTGCILQQGGRLESGLAQRPRKKDFSPAPGSPEIRAAWGASCS